MLTTWDGRLLGKEQVQTRMRPQGSGSHPPVPPRGSTAAAAPRGRQRTGFPLPFPPALSTPAPDPRASPRLRPPSLRPCAQAQEAALAAPVGAGAAGLRGRGGRSVVKGNNADSSSRFVELKHGRAQERLTVGLQLNIMETRVKFVR